MNEHLLAPLGNRIAPAQSAVPVPVAGVRGVRATKTVRTAADLAINGAPPLFDTQVHVGRPNVGNTERFLARARTILESGWLSNNGPTLIEFEQRIIDKLGVKNCVAMCNGTIALEIAMRALDLAARSSFHPTHSWQPRMHCSGRKSHRSSPISIP